MMVPAWYLNLISSMHGVNLKIIELLIFIVFYNEVRSLWFVQRLLQNGTLTDLSALFISVLPPYDIKAWTGKINLRLYLLCPNKFQRLCGEKKRSIHTFNRSWCHITSSTFCLLTGDQPVAADLGLDATKPLACPAQICLLETFTTLLLSRRVFSVFAGSALFRWQ